MKVEIKFADLEDLDFICKIDMESFSDKYSREYFFCCIVNKNIFVAKIRDRVIGFILFTILFDESEILKIAVDRDYRHLSVGTMIIEKYIEFVNLDLSRKLMLEVRESNIFAIRLYEKFGYEVVRKIKNYYSNPAEDGLFMLRGN